MTQDISEMSVTIDDFIIEGILQALITTEHQFELDGKFTMTFRG